MSSLKHPNIVRFLQVIETKQFVHLVMELIRNGSLNQLIQERKRLAHTFTDAEASQIMRGLLRAVEYMHSK
jgi:serine/threonine protein kinase